MTKREVLRLVLKYELTDFINTTKTEKGEVAVSGIQRMCFKATKYEEWSLLIRVLLHIKGRLAPLRFHVRVNFFAELWAQHLGHIN